MAGNTYLDLQNGFPSRVAASDVSVGAADAGKLVALNAQGDIDTSMLPPGIGADTASIVASEAIGAGDFVNVFDDGGTPKIRLADASALGKQAHGFVLAAVSQDASGTVYFEGTNNQVTGLTAGNVWLSPMTPGGTTATPPSTTGQIVQKVGVAVGATEINAEIGQVYVL